MDTHTYSSQYSEAGRAKGMKSGTAVPAACQAYLSAYHFGHAC
jgi:hypothetical protein